MPPLAPSRRTHLVTGPGAPAFQLTQEVRGKAPFVEYFPSHAALAERVRALLNCRPPYSWREWTVPFDNLLEPLPKWADCRLVAHSRRGNALSIAELLAAGERNLQERYGLYRNRYFSGYTPGSGLPVPHTGRRGSGHGYRHVRTTNETCLNNLVVEEDGEVPVRAARRGHNLPNSWDDVPRGHERSWKSQYIGRKAWDRPGRG